MAPSLPSHPLEGLDPVLDAGRHVVALLHVPAVHHQSLGADRRRGLGVLQQDLARRDADLVVRRRHVDDVRRVHVDVDAVVLRRLHLRA